MILGIKARKFFTIFEIGSETAHMFKASKKLGKINKNTKKYTNFP